MFPLFLSLQSKNCFYSYISQKSSERQGPVEVSPSCFSAGWRFNGAAHTLTGTRLLMTSHAPDDKSCPSCAAALWFPSLFSRFREGFALCLPASSPPRGTTSCAHHERCYRPVLVDALWRIDPHPHPDLGVCWYLLTSGLHCTEHFVPISRKRQHTSSQILTW